MTEYDNTNSGMLQRNKKKTEEKHPDLGGVLNVEGVEYWLSGWSRKKQDGSPYFSLKIKPKEK